MSSNISGKIFNLNTWGESNGKAIGCGVAGSDTHLRAHETE